MRKEELRARYGSASDEELEELIAQGPLQFTPAAWALLNEESARRPSIGRPAPIPRPPATTGQLLVHALRRAIQAQGRRGYTLGWLFVLTVASRISFEWMAALAVPLTPVERVAVSMNVLQLLFNTIAGVAATLRRPWCWYALIIGIPADVVLMAGGLALWLGFVASRWQELRFVQTQAVSMIVGQGLVVAGLTLLDVLWFPYFYRRAARFGAHGGLGWLIPRVFRRRLTVPGPRLLDLSWAVWLAIAGAIALVILGLRTRPF